MSISCSLIVPVLNEEKLIQPFIIQLQKVGCFEEVIFVDGGSRDNTVVIIKKSPFTLLESEEGRALQLNAGARHAKSEFLLFLHVDTVLPKSFEDQIVEWKNGPVTLGNFRLKFDWNHPLLNFYARFSHFKRTVFQFGDQALWVERKLFFQAGPYNGDMLILEDQELVRRLMRKTILIKSKHSLTTSARKYRKEGVLRLQLIYTLVFLLYRLNLSQQKLVKVYNYFLRSNQINFSAKSQGSVKAGKADN